MGKVKLTQYWCLFILITAYQFPMGKVKKTLQIFMRAAEIVSIPYGKGKVKEIGAQEGFLLYQFPMGKVK